MELPAGYRLIALEPRSGVLDGVVEATVALAMPGRLDRIRKQLLAARPTATCLILENLGYRAVEQRWRDDGPPIATSHEDLAHAFCVACDVLRHLEGRVLFVEDDCVFDLQGARVRREVSEALQLWPEAPVLHLGCVPLVARAIHEKALVLSQSLGTHAVVLTARARRRMSRALRADPRDSRLSWLLTGRLPKRDLDLAVNALFPRRLALRRAAAYQSFPETENMKTWASGGPVPEALGKAVCCYTKLLGLGSSSYLRARYEMAYALVASPLARPIYAAVLSLANLPSRRASSSVDKRNVVATEACFRRGPLLVTGGLRSGADPQRHE